MNGCGFRWFKLVRMTMSSSSSLANECCQWSSIRCEKKDLRIDITLVCGQSFRWHEKSPGIWTGVMGDRVWRLSQTDHELLYQVFEKRNVSENDCKRLKSSKQAKAELDNLRKNALDSFCKIPAESETTYADILNDYFQLDINLESLYAEFSERDPFFRNKASHLKGVRLLRQDPVETLFSFICSSNNNITRISGMVERMCQHFGDKITQLDGEDYHTFPSIDRLAGDDVEQTLRELGFGYRAKFIMESAKQVVSKGGLKHLFELRAGDYETAKASLMELHGVGAKVADCICLLSLDKMDAIPVDTHVKQIAERDYSLRFTTKSCTDAVYNKIGEFFRNLWGPYAGWAQCVLFALDLKKFKDDTLKSSAKEDVQVEQKTFKKQKRKLPT